MENCIYNLKRMPVVRLQPFNFKYSKVFLLGQKESTGEGIYTHTCTILTQPYHNFMGPSEVDRRQGDREDVDVQTVMSSVWLEKLRGL